MKTNPYYIIIVVYALSCHIQMSVIFDINLKMKFGNVLRSIKCDETHGNNYDSICQLSFTGNIA